MIHDDIGKVKEIIRNVIHDLDKTRFVCEGVGLTKISDGLDYCIHQLDSTIEQLTNALNKKMNEDLDNVKKSSVAMLDFAVALAVVEKERGYTATMNKTENDNG